jgi:capping protein beta
LEQLLSPNPDALYELTQHVVLPLQTAVDTATGKPYIASPLNRFDGDCRAPSSENFMEANANELWGTYKSSYYGKNAVGSVYILGENPLKACFLLQHTTEEGQWNSSHVVNVNTKGLATIQSAFLVTIGGEMSAHLSQETSRKLAHPTIEAIGPILEEIEMNIRSSLERVHLPKTRDVVQELVKKKKPPAAPTMGLNHTAMLNQAVLMRASMQKKK